MAVGPAVLPIDRLLAIYNLLLVAVWGAVIARAPYAPWIFAAHAAALALPWLLRRAGDRFSTPGRVLREIYPLLWLLAFWTELDYLRWLLHGRAHDDLIVALDVAVFGTQPHAIWFSSMPDFWVSEGMNLLYFGYYPLIVLPPVIAGLLGRTAAFRDMIFRMLAAYLACYVIYIAYPVDGPHYLMVRPDGQHTQGIFYRLVYLVQAAGDSRGAAFPSSHVVGAVTIAYLGWRWFSPAVALLLSAEALGVVLSTVYTLNHYAIDSAAGVVWGLGLQLLFVPVLYRRLERGAAPASVPALPKLSPEGST